ncbi:MAG: methyltransferase, TIGR04325 family [Bacteroidia bacterium]|nr:methyltransferase, TIGR04325 family [Bacteroidia bacterium]
MGEIKKLLKALLPTIIISVIQRFKTPVKIQRIWFGNYDTWAAAMAQCTGYDSDVIFEKCKNALLKVKNGEAVYERDSVLFDEIEYSFPLLSGLMWIAAQNNGKLNIIDFGGSLGSSYFQNRLFLKDLKEVNWNIVEQPKFVEIGKKEFETNELNFFYTIEECLELHKSNTILLSGVIQYLENPFEFIIIDRTAFVFNGNDVLTIQKVPSEIYDATYPAWLFNKELFLSLLLKKYCLLTEFNTHIGFIINTGSVSANYKGFIFKKNKYENFI